MRNRTSVSWFLRKQVQFCSVFSSVTLLCVSVSTVSRAAFSLFKSFGKLSWSCLHKASQSRLCDFETDANVRKTAVVIASRIRMKSWSVLWKPGVVFPKQAFRCGPPRGEKGTAAAGEMKIRKSTNEFGQNLLRYSHNHSTPVKLEFADFQFFCQ